MASVTRLVATAGDMDISGLAAVGYYLRLYAVELILGELQRPKEQTELATELLNQVEEYKGIVDAAKDEDPAAYTLLHDQGKAKTYVLNFAMSLYNEKLLQLQKGPWDQALRRGLWCCLDLFNCAGKLWDMEEIVKDRIKYCKIYLTRIAKEKSPPGATLPDAPSEEPEVAIDILKDAEKSKELKELDYADFIMDTQTTDDEIDNMLKKLKASDAAQEEGEPEFLDDESNELPQNKLTDHIAKENNAVADNTLHREGNKVHTPPSLPIVAPAPPSVSIPATTVDLQSIMDRSAAFEQVQRRAKYAISALNYEDVATARQELTAALSLLEKLD
ncbi:VTA1 (YLR181C) [Zygosaccharomyces parabailii]|nr:VTA1 (YLR181C) [Zygosaccharomyces parabailii]CDH13323.1 related to Vacuolar protein sorting-associated protein VTA1 [Zygosaccharomyces bailii ISA1307]